MGFFIARLTLEQVMGKQKRKKQSKNKKVTPEQLSFLADFITFLAGDEKDRVRVDEFEQEPEVPINVYRNTKTDALTVTLYSQHPDYQEIERKAVEEGVLKGEGRSLGDLRQFQLAFVGCVLERGQDKDSPVPFEHTRRIVTLAKRQFELNEAVFRVIEEAEGEGEAA